eukprot:g31225.t1
MWELFKDLLVRVQGQHVPVRRKDKNDKLRVPWIMREVVNFVKRKKEAYEKDMEENAICKKHANMLGHFEIKNGVVFSLLKSIKVVKSSGHDDICTRLLRETRGEISGALTKIFLSSLVTGEVLED